MSSPTPQTYRVVLDVKLVEELEGGLHASLVVVDGLCAIIKVPLVGAVTIVVVGAQVPVCGTMVLLGEGM